jgi:2-polyprenyl-3-methyl-5-hydroxy-6-metoxy-1,4-benzoquinol methylase
MNISLNSKEDISKRKHWYINDQLMLSEHPFYSWPTKKRLAFFERCIDDYVRTTHSKQYSPLMLLDAGCGDGVVLKILDGRQHCRILGCEYNFIRAQRARSNCKQAFVVNASLINSPFKSGLFHIIIINQVLEHISDDISVLCELNRMLRYDGMLIIGVPNEGCFLGRLRNRYIQPWIQKQTDHVHFYTKEKISSKIKKAGFSIIFLRRDGYTFPHSRVTNLLASFQLGFKLLNLLGKIFKSQCGGLYFICKKSKPNR